jgi:hypothetical protein
VEHQKLRADTLLKILYHAGKASLGQALKIVFYLLAKEAIVFVPGEPYKPTLKGDPLSSLRAYQRKTVL